MDSVFSKFFGGNKAMPAGSQGDQGDTQQAPNAQGTQDTVSASMPVDPQVSQTGPNDPVPQPPVEPPAPPAPEPQPQPTSEQVPVESTPPAAPVTPDIPVQPTNEAPPQNDNGISQEERDKIGSQLVKTMVEAVDAKKLTDGEMSVISGYILDTIDNIKTQAELMDFLSGLAWRWPIFKNMLKVAKGVARESTDDQKAQEVESLIKENKIEEALDVAQVATSTT